VYPEAEKDQQAHQIIEDASDEMPVIGLIVADGAGASREAMTISALSNCGGKNGGFP
jgi:hypothetical protein